MAKYEDVLSIPAFAGINQANDGHNIDFRYAVDGFNFDTTNGGFRPYRKSKIIPISYEEGFDSVAASPEGKYTWQAANEVTIAMLNKRWKKGVSGIIPTDDTVYAVMISAGRIYYRQSQLQSSSADRFYNAEWKELLNGGNSFDFTNNKFDHVTYEINFAEAVALDAATLASIVDGSVKADTFDADDGKYYTLLADENNNAYYENYQGDKITMTVGTSMVRVGYEAPVDCLLITNASDGMYCIYAPLDSDDLLIRKVTVQPVGTTQEIKFGCIARHAERVFGAGIDSDPDKVMYSATYDPFNWEQNNIEPDDGAGDIQQPNWDGDGFVALRDFGNQLLLIKRHAVWRMTGTTPSEFVMRKQYGAGTIAEDSVVVIGANAYMLADNDIMVYDGASTRPVRKNVLQKYMPVPNNAQKAFACEWDGKYVLYTRSPDDFMPTNYFAVYNTHEGTFNVISTNNVFGMTSKDETLYLVEGENAIINGETFPKSVLKEAFAGECPRVEWVSAWQDLGAKNVVKSGFVLYVTMHDNYPNLSSYPLNEIEFTIEIETEKKIKTKTVQLTPMKTKRIRINNSGRMFRVHMIIPPASTDWKLATGIQMYLEYDAD